MSNPFFTGISAGGSAGKAEACASDLKPIDLQATPAVPQSTEVGVKTRGRRERSSISSSRLQSILFWSTRLSYVLFALFTILAMQAAMSLAGSGDDMAEWDGEHLTLNVVFCQYGAGSSFTPDDSGGGTGRYRITGTHCTNASLVLNLVAVATVLSLLALLTYSVFQHLVYFKMGRDGLQYYFKGVVSGMGFFGALLFFLTGWALLAVAWFVDSFFEG